MYHCCHHCYYCCTTITTTITTTHHYSTASNAVTFATNTDTTASLTTPVHTTTIDVATSTTTLLPQPQPQQRPPLHILSLSPALTSPLYLESCCNRLGDLVDAEVLGKRRGQLDVQRQQLVVTGHPLPSHLGCQRSTQGVNVFEQLALHLTSTWWHCIVTSRSSAWQSELTSYMAEH